MTSCKKAAKEPDYPQLVGTWKGTTSQNIPIEISVGSSDADLYILSVSLKFSSAPGDTTSVSKYSSSGLALISGTSFNVVLEGSFPYQTFVQGTFNPTALTVTGAFTGYSPTAPQTPVSGTYTGTKQ